MPVTHLDSERWILETQHSGYALGLNDAGRLVHCYWGRRMMLPGDYPAPESPWGWASFNGPGQLTPEEYPGYAGLNYTEP